MPCSPGLRGSVRGFQGAPRTLVSELISGPVRADPEHEANNECIFVSGSIWGVPKIGVPFLRGSFEGYKRGTPILGNAHIR